MARTLYRYRNAVRTFDQLDHGTTSTYGNWRCRCADCRRANTAYNLRARLNRMENPPPGLVHGRYSTYTNYCCRCELCQEARRQQERKSRRGAA